MFYLVRQLNYVKTEAYQIVSFCKKKIGTNFKTVAPQGFSAVSFFVNETHKKL